MTSKINMSARYSNLTADVVVRIRKLHAANRVQLLKYVVLYRS